MTSLPAAAPAGPGTGQDNVSSPWRPWNGGHRVLQRSGRAEPGHRPEPRSGFAPPGSTGPARHATALALPPPTPDSPVTAADVAADCNDARSTHQPLPPGPATTPSPPRQPPSSQWKDYHPTPAQSNDTTDPAPTTPTSTHDAAHPTAQHTSRNCCCAHPLNPPTLNRFSSAFRAQGEGLGVGKGCGSCRSWFRLSRSLRSLAGSTGFGEGRSRPGSTGFGEGRSRSGSTGLRCEIPWTSRLFFSDRWS